MGRRAEIPWSVEHFKPPFCPDENCEYHLHRGGTDWPWQSRGTRPIRRRPGVVREFSCKACGRWFRASVFGPDYWTKKPGLGQRTHALLNAGCAMRRAAKFLAVAPTTVRRRARLIAKQSLLITVEQNSALTGRVEEEMLLDGMRSFAGSQYEPLDMQTTIFAESGYLPGLNIAGLRRSGTMTEKQKRVREQRDEPLGLPEPQGREHRTRELLELFRVLGKPGQPLTVRCDEEPDYARALARPTPIEGMTLLTVNSRVLRDASNPLFKINVLHGFMRHNSRNLVRETIAFAKTAAGLLDRAWIFLVYQNNIKGESERTTPRSRITPAMKLGLRKKQATVRGMFTERRFPKRVGLPPWLESAYLGTFRARPNENVKPYIHKFVA
jgi:hypothetical protein